MSASAAACVLPKTLPTNRALFFLLCSALPQTLVNAKRLGTCQPPLCPQRPARAECTLVLNRAGREAQEASNCTFSHSHSPGCPLLQWHLPVWGLYALRISVKKRLRPQVQREDWFRHSTVRVWPGVCRDWSWAFQKADQPWGPTQPSSRPRPPVYLSQSQRLLRRAQQQAPPPSLP